MLTTALALLALASTDAGAAIPNGGAIEIEVENVRSADGFVLVQLCPRTEFLEKCVIGGRVPARAGSVSIRLAAVPPGDYAAMAFHDKNGNGTLDRWLGVPREDIGFSRMPRLPFRPPRFNDADFAHGAADQKVTVRLSNYFG